jgi:hypothetical protein
MCGILHFCSEHFIISSLHCDRDLPSEHSLFLIPLSVFSSMDEPTMNPPTSHEHEGTILQSFASLSPTEQQQQQKIPLLNDRYEFNVEALGLLQGHSPFSFLASALT